MFSTLNVLTALAALTGPEIAAGPTFTPSPPSVGHVVRAGGESAVEGSLPPVPSLPGASATDPTNATRSSSNRNGTPGLSRAPDGERPSLQPIAGVAILERCLVSLIEDLEITAQEDGLLKSVEARPGVEVNKDDLLAQVDDAEPTAKHAASEAAYNRAKAEAENDVNERFAAAAEGVAKAEYDSGNRANSGTRGSVTRSEMRRRKLSWDKAALQIEQARHERTLAARDADVRAAEKRQTTLAIKRRKIESPIDGMVLEVKKRRGEWVTRGEPLIRLVRMNRLHVTGHVSAAQFGPQEISGRAVSILVRLERGRTERFTGKITFVHPEVNGGDYLVRAEIQNRREGDQWILRPGLNVDMTVHVDPDRVTANR